MSHIRLGCATVLVSDERVLLGVRAKNPNKGKLVIPGGGVKQYESLEQCAVREFKEETGLSVKLIRQLTTRQIIEPTVQHRVIVYWLAELVDGVLVSNSDLSDAKFYTKEEFAHEIANGNVSEIAMEVLRDLEWTIKK